MSEDREGRGRPPDGGASLETTASLLALVRQGDDAARERLVSRYQPALTRWAHGRLPTRARGLSDTDDLVQITLLDALDHVKGFEPRHAGAFLAYMRRILINKIRDLIREAARRPPKAQLDEAVPDWGPSPLESAVGSETMRRYERALAQLTDEQQEAVVMRIEMGFTYPEIAAAMGSPSSNAARMLVSRGLVRLAEVLGEEQGGGR
jgi:RNA polymerase sigma-70 factor (ECF subfamily)